MQHELKKLALESDGLFAGLIAVCDDLYLAAKTVYLNNPVKVRKTAKTPLAERRKLARQKALERMRAHYQSGKNISWREAERLTQAEMWREFRDLGLAYMENNFHKLRFG